MDSFNVGNRADAKNRQKDGISLMKLSHNTNSPIISRRLKQKEGLENFN